MNFHTSHNVDVTRAKKTVEHYTEKFLKKNPRLDSDNISVWVKNLNPEHSAGVEKFHCKVELKNTNNHVAAETDATDLHNAIKHSFEVFSKKLDKDRFDQKKLREFKRNEIIS